MVGRSELLIVALVMVPTGIEWNAHGNTGSMQHMISPDGCNDRSREVAFAGLSGQLTYRGPGTGGKWDHRLEARVGGNVVAGRLAGYSATSGPRDIRIGYGTATIGWDSRYLGFRFGVYAGNVDEEEDDISLPAASVRLGTRTRFLRLSAFDQPHCYPADCVFGVEAGTDMFTLGGSIGITTGRVFARGRIPGIIGGLDLRGGLFVGADDGDPSGGALGQNFVLSLGLGGHWDTAPALPQPARSNYSGPPGGY